MCAREINASLQCIESNYYYVWLVDQAEKAMAPHSSTPAWKIPWMEEPGGLQSMGLLRVGNDWATSLSLFTFMHWRRKWQPHSSVLAWRIPGTAEPGGLASVGLHRVGHDWSDLAAADQVLWTYCWSVAGNKDTPVSVFVFNQGACSLFILRIEFL